MLDHVETSFEQDNECERTSKMDLLTEMNQLNPDKYLDYTDRSNMVFDFGYRSSKVVK